MDVEEEDLPRARAWLGFRVRCPQCEAEGFSVCGELDIDSMPEEMRDELREEQGIQPWEDDSELSALTVRPYRCRDCGVRSMPIPDGWGIEGEEEG